MKKKILQLLSLALLILSCSDDSPHSIPEELPSDNEKLISKKFKFGVEASFEGDFDQGPHDLFNIQVYDTESGAPYAMVLADDTEKFSIDFEENKKYEILVNYIRNGKKEVRPRENLGWFLPFLPSWSSATPINIVKYSDNEEFRYITNPSISVESGLHETYVPVDQYFGHLPAYVAERGNSEVSFQLHRMVFGLTVDLTLEDVPEIETAFVTIHPRIENQNSPRKFEISLEAGKGVLEIPYLTLETNEGQDGDLRSILTDGYEETMMLSIGTEQEPGRFYNSQTKVKRMVMHHMDLIWGPNKNISLKLEEEPMTSEDIFLNLNPNDRIKTLTLKTDTHQIIADGASMASLEVAALDEFGNDVVDAEIELEVNGIPYHDQAFKSTEPRVYYIYARAGDDRSNEIKIEAVRNKVYEEVNLPIIFHIVHFGDRIGANSNLTADHAHRLLEQLNLGFSNNYGSANPNSVDTGIRFRLAQFAPDGSSLEEPGINRIDATPYDVGSTANMRMTGRPWPVDNKNGTGGIFSGDKGYDKHLGKDEAYRMAQDHHWDMNDYLNVYIFPIQPDLELAGYAYYPIVMSSNPIDGLEHTDDNYYFKLDQCVINTRAVLKESYHVLIHEVGHNLGLNHTFSSDNCKTSDYCSDTYSYRKGYPNQPCSDNIGLNEHDNFMDYIGASNTFTYQQRERMRQVLNFGYYYSNLKNSEK